jgi:hypothetical protein
MSWKNCLKPDEIDALVKLDALERGISKQRLRIRKRAWAQMLRERTAKETA